MSSKNLKFLENSNLELGFTNKSITSYGGFCLFAKLFEKIELKENLNKMFPVTEDSPNSRGVDSKLLKFGFTVLAGGERFSDTIHLGDSSEVYQEMLGLEKKMVKSSTAITRLFNKVDSFELCQELAEALWSYSFDYIVPLKKIEKDYLNFDSTVITRYGEQEGAEVGYNPKKKGRSSHHPNMAFLNESKYVVNLWNRPGNCPSGNGVVGFFKETFARLDNRLEISACLCDSGYYDLEFIEHLESIDVKYVVAAPLRQTVQQAILEQKDWVEVDKGIWVTDFMFQHKSGDWKKERRYVVIRQDQDLIKTAKGKKLNKKVKDEQLNLITEHDDIEKYSYNCLVTNLTDDPVEVWRTYRKRADDENIIKENASNFGLRGFSLDKFFPTEAAMLIRILFYNITNLLKSECLPEQDKKCTLKTIRYRYLVIPSQMGADGRTMVLRLGIKRQALREKIKWILNQIDVYFKDFAKCIAVDTG